MTNTSLVTLDNDDGIALTDDVQVESLIDCVRNSVLNVGDPVFFMCTRVREWVNTSIKMAESGGSVVSGNHQDWTVRSVFGAESCGCSGSG